jgi:hypothetical protein
MLKSGSTRVAWIRCHASVLIALDRSLRGTVASPAARPNAASLWSVVAGLAREWHAPRHGCEQEADDHAQHMQIGGALPAGMDDQRHPQTRVPAADRW